MKEITLDDETTVESKKIADNYLNVNTNIDLQVVTDKTTEFVQNVSNDPCQCFQSNNRLLVYQESETFFKDSDEKEEFIFSNENRVKKFPILNYSTLYHSLLNITEIIPTIQISQIG